MNVERTDSYKRKRDAELRASVDPRERVAWADGKISVPRGFESGFESGAPKGAPLGAAAGVERRSSRERADEKRIAALEAAFAPRKREKKGQKSEKKSGASAPGCEKSKAASSSEGNEGRSDADRVASVLAHALRPLMGRSQAKCRLYVVAPRVTFVEYLSGKGRSRLVCEGLSTCKSCNCPLCVRKWERVRTAEIQSAVANWMRKHLPVIFASLTMRHHPNMPLALQARILGIAYGNLWSGNKGKQFAAAVGGKPESVRAIDLTWSEEAWWHPHLHALLFHGAELEITLDEFEDLFRHRWQEALPATLKSMKNMVARMLGDARRPLDSGPCSVHRKFMAHVEKRAKRCWRGHALHRRLASRRPATRGGAEPRPESWDPIDEHHQCSDCAFELGLQAVRFKQKKKKKRGKPPEIVEVVVGQIPAPGDRVLHEEWRGETCSACMFGTGECPNNRERAARMFGKSLVPDHVPLRDSMLRLRGMLRQFTAKNILPDFERGVVLDRIHKGDPFDQVASYLPKLGAIGFELASSSTKLGWEDERGRRHYTKWEVAQLCAMRGQPKTRNAARRAWRQMYAATKGLAQITFSDREALGLGENAYANGNEPPEIDVDEGETRRVLGHAEKPEWVGMAKQHGHMLVGALHSAHRAGTLQRLSWVQPPMGGEEPQPVVEPSERAPPEVSEGLEAAQAAAARARWRAVQRRLTYDVTKLDRSRRWEHLRAVAEVRGPEAWHEMTRALLETDQWLGSGAVRGAEHWQHANAAHERRSSARDLEHFDRVTGALDALGEAGALQNDPTRLRRNELLLRIELARTLRRTGLDRTTADRLAREMIN